MEAETPHASAMPKLRPSRTSLALLALAATLALGASRRPAIDADTLRDRAQPRINAAPSHKEAGSGRPVAWLRDAVTITLDPSLDQAGPGVDAVREAFGAWISTDARLPSVSFENATAMGVAQRDGVNRVLMAPIGVPGHQKDLSITISYMDEATGELLEVDIVFNSEYRFLVLPAGGTNAKASGSPSPKCGPGSYDLQNVAAHEVGHFFGLGEDRDDALSTMFFESRACEIVKRDLEVSDAAALVTHYQRAAEAQEEQMACSAARRSSSSTGALGIALAALALIGRRRSILR